MLSKRERNKPYVLEVLISFFFFIVSSLPIPYQVSVSYLSLCSSSCCKLIGSEDEDGF
ncbi:predicted protein [Arabidopsis lyrata subsp. lyrata]|uniref:Predicted protein n=1 Tax=Arabidopsis lyrata subsp. lyrata TaxID=81972 RepID=D7L444_ARALL|nr:predicted protein [Arabidopsis lyrata subsp. lyrata]